MNEFPPVIIEREYKASPDRLFRAWTEPATLTKWFRSSEKAVVESVELDLRVGGQFRIAIRHPDLSYEIFGTYLRIEAPELLEFTWKMAESELEPNETRVKVDFEPSSNGTLLRITHTRFTSEASFKAHGIGWNNVLESLASLLAKG